MGFVQKTTLKSLVSYGGVMQLSEDNEEKFVEIEESDENYGILLSVTYFMNGHFR